MSKKRVALAVSLSVCRFEHVWEGQPDRQFRVTIGEPEVVGRQEEIISIEDSDKVRALSLLLGKNLAVG